MDRAPDELLRLLAERTSDVYWTTDDRGILTYLAPQVVVLIGRQPHELVGAPMQALESEEDFEEAASLQRAIMERASTCTVAYRLKRAAGHPIWAEATVHVV